MDKLLSSWLLSQYSLESYFTLLHYCVGYSCLPSPFHSLLIGQSAYYQKIIIGVIWWVWDSWSKSTILTLIWLFTNVHYSPNDSPSAPPWNGGRLLSVSWATCHHLSCSKIVTGAHAYTSRYGSLQHNTCSSEALCSDAIDSKLTVFNMRYLGDALLIGLKGGFFRATNTKSKLQAGNKDLVTPFIHFRPETHFLTVLNGKACPWQERQETGDMESHTPSGAGGCTPPPHGVYEYHLLRFVHPYLHQSLLLQWEWGESIQRQPFPLLSQGVKSDSLQMKSPAIPKREMSVLDWHKQIYMWTSQYLKQLPHHMETTLWDLPHSWTGNRQGGCPLPVDKLLVARHSSKSPTCTGLWSRGWAPSR